MGAIVARGWNVCQFGPESETNDNDQSELMLLGIISDTHNDLDRTRQAVAQLRAAGAEALINCGDLSSPPIVAECASLPFWFVLGNHDSDSMPALQNAAVEHGATCLDWGGVVELAGRRIAVAHGHLTTDVDRVLADRPDYFLFGHTHAPSDDLIDGTRRINPGALFRAERFTAALLDLASGSMQLLELARYPGLESFKSFEPPS
jgi:putative phosphoesterase